MCDLQQRSGGEIRPDDGLEHYLVAFDDPIVAQDLCEIVLECDPRAVVHQLDGPRAVAAVAAQLSRVAAAFVGADLARARDCGVVAALAGRGGRLVLLGDLAEDSVARTGLRGTAEGLDWVILQRPFATSQVQALLGAAG